MKKWLFFLAVLGAVAVISGRTQPGTDVSQMQPVQSVRIAQFNRYITVETDTGAWGMGGDLDAALEHMNASAPAHIFLDTAEYLVIAPELVFLLPDLEDRLRPSCCVCLEEGQPDMTRVGQFLQIHTPEITMNDYLAGVTDLPTLLTTKEGMQLVQ